jgi:hypothetical protein
LFLVDRLGGAIPVEKETCVLATKEEAIAAAKTRAPDVAKRLPSENSTRGCEGKHMMIRGTTRLLRPIPALTASHAFDGAKPKALAFSSPRSMLRVCRSAHDRVNANPAKASTMAATTTAVSMGMANLP